MKCTECGHQNYEPVMEPIYVQAFPGMVEEGVPDLLPFGHRWACVKCDRYHFADGRAYSPKEAPYPRSPEPKTPAASNAELLVCKICGRGYFADRKALSKHTIDEHDCFSDGTELTYLITHSQHGYLTRDRTWTDDLKAAGSFTKMEATALRRSMGD